MTSANGEPSKIGVRNDTSRPRIVWVEPWGEDYTLLPGERLEIVAWGVGGPERPYFEACEYDEGVQIYIEGPDGDWAVVQNGEKIDCGHKRQAAIDAGLKL